MYEMFGESLRNAYPFALLDMLNDYTQLLNHSIRCFALRWPWPLSYKVTCKLYQEKHKWAQKILKAHSQSFMKA